MTQPNFDNAVLIADLREQIAKQRAVRRLGSMGDGVEVDCDHLEVLLNEVTHLGAEAGRVKHELSVVVSTKHKKVREGALARAASRFQVRAQRLNQGLMKYRQQHLLDKDYIQRQKRELRRLNKLVPPIERANVSEVKVGGACQLCGCLFPATDHDSLKRNLKAVVESRDALTFKLRAVVGENRRLKAGVK